MTESQHVEQLEALLDKALTFAYGALAGLHQLPAKTLHDLHKTAIDELSNEVDALEAKVADGYY